MALQLALMRGEMAGMRLCATCSLLLALARSPTLSLAPVHPHSGSGGAPGRALCRTLLPGERQKATALSYRKSACLAIPDVTGIFNRAPGRGVGRMYIGMTVRIERKDKRSACVARHAKRDASRHGCSYRNPPSANLSPRITACCVEIWLRSTVTSGNFSAEAARIAHAPACLAGGERRIRTTQWRYTPPLAGA